MGRGGEGWGRGGEERRAEESRGENGYVLCVRVCACVCVRLRSSAFVFVRLRASACVCVCLRGAACNACNSCNV